MATLDDSPSLCRGQPWVAWAHKVEGNHSREHEEEINVVSRSTKDDSDSMKLRKQDMPLYGLCPACDEFYLVVCERCGQVIKPQAFQTHIEQRHHGVIKSLTSRTSHSRKPVKTACESKPPQTKKFPPGLLRPDMQGKSPPHPSPPGKCPIRTETPTAPPIIPDMQRIKEVETSLPVVKLERMPAPVVEKVTESVGNKDEPELILPSVFLKDEPPSAPLISNGEDIKPAVIPTISCVVTETEVIKPVVKEITPPVVKEEFPKVVAPAVPITTSVPTVTTAATTTVTAASYMTISLTGATTTTVATTTSPSAGSRRPQKEKRFLPCKDRRFDADQHCGVWIEDLARNCTRSLTCKTHALSLRRSVEGRSKSFDDLLKEHRAAKEAATLKAKAAAAGSVTPVKSPGSWTLAPSNGHVSTAIEPKGKSPQHLGSPSTSTAQPRLIRLAPGKRVPPTPKQRPSTLPVFPREEAIPLPETSSRLSSDGEDEDEIDKDSLDYPHIPYHPRPAAVNGFGSWLHGKGCYATSRKEDLFRAAFAACLEKHLHPPPHKKLCLESRLPQGSHHVTNAKDPYEFTLGESVIVKSSCATGSGGLSSISLPNRLKPKTIVTTSSSCPSYMVEPKETAGSRAPLLSATPGLTLTNSCPSGSTKRKRSGGGTVSCGQTGAISIAIPAGNLNLNLSSSAFSDINASLAAHKVTPSTTNKNSFLKDLSIVVTNIEPAILNGQLVSIAGANLSDVKQVQLNCLPDKTAKVKASKTTTGPTLKPALMGDSSSVNALVTALPQGTYVMDSTSRTGALMNQPNVSVTMVTASGVSICSATRPTPTHTPTSYKLTSSNSSSPVPNGVLSSAHAVGVKNVGLNLGSLGGGSSHVGSPTPALTAVTPEQLHLLQQSAISSGKKSVATTLRIPAQLQRSSQSVVKPGLPAQVSISAATAQQLAAAALNLNVQANRPLTSHGLQQLYTNAVLSQAAGQLAPLQLQHKATAKSAHGSKVAMQPVSLTIVAPSAVQGVNPDGAHQQQTAFLVQSEDDHKLDLSRPVEHSPSNIIS